MKLSGTLRGVLAVVAVTVAVSILWAMPVLAQCPLCKMAVENSAQGRAMSRGLNQGIIVLLVPPVTVFCSIFILAFKHRKARNG